MTSAAGTARNSLEGHPTGPVNRFGSVKPLTALTVVLVVVLTLVPARRAGRPLPARPQTG
jgi:hypothetical protein